MEIKELNANTAVEREQRLLAGYVERRGINKVNSLYMRTNNWPLSTPKRSDISI